MNIKKAISLVKQMAAKPCSLRMGSGLTCESYAKAPKTPDGGRCLSCSARNWVRINKV